MNSLENTKSNLWKVALVGAALLSLFVLLLSVNEIKLIAQHTPSPVATNTITVTGEGSAVAIPDIATFSFSVTETAKVITDAQNAATTKTNAAIKAMTDAGVKNADIQTLSYNINPHYEYTGGVCNTNSICTPARSTLTGYDVSQTIQVKVRDLSKAGSLLQAVGSLGVQNVDSLQFSIDKPDAIQDQARAKAIANAQEKAEALSKELDVDIVRIVDFSENAGNTVSPMMYATKSVGMQSDAAVAPSVPTGQQKVTSNVSITYEIR